MHACGKRQLRVDAREHLVGTTGLARYFDYGRSPVPEESDDSTYCSDVIRWLVAHPGKDREGLLVKGAGHPDAGQARRLKETSCDVQASLVLVGLLNRVLGVA